MKETRQKHEEEILKTRSAGFGGSDAEMVIGIAERLQNNIKLTLTQKRRLRVIAKIDAPQPSIETQEMLAGRDWEDTMTDRLLPNGFVREYLMMWHGEPFRHFAVFAHADFFRLSDGLVCECKWTRAKTEDEILYDYKWQFAQYRMLGAMSVDVAINSDCGETLVRWTDDGGYAEQLLKSYRLIDEKWDLIVSNMLEINETEGGQLPPDIAQAIHDMEWLKEEIATREAKYKELQAQVRLWMEQRDIQKVNGERYTLTYTPATESVKFDSKGLQKTYPKIYEQFVAYTMRSAYVTLKARKEGE